MAEIIKPTDLNKIWASAGAIVAPDDAKIATGWIVEAPPHQTENYINNKHDKALAYLNQHGVVQWDSSTEYQANKSWVQGSNGSLYYAKQTHVNQNPVLDTTETYWNLVLQGTGVVHKADTTSFSRTWLANANSAATGRSQLGSTSIGDAVFTASTTAVARASLGSTTVGDAVYTSASALAARTAIGVVSASDTEEGIVERATDAEVVTGTDDTRFVTPKKLKLGFSVQLAPNGHFKMPSWLGGLVINWGTTYVPDNSNSTQAVFTLPFPTSAFGVVCTGQFSNTTDYEERVAIGYYNLTNSLFYLSNPRDGGGGLSTFWIAIGY